MEMTDSMGTKRRSSRDGGDDGALEEEEDEEGARLTMSWRIEERESRRLWKESSGDARLQYNPRDIDCEVGTGRDVSFQDG